MRRTAGDGPTPPQDSTGRADERAAPALLARMSDLSRRAFLRRSALTVGLASAAGAVPGLGGLLVNAEPDVAATAPAVSGIEDSAVSTASPLVAHVTDIATGQISLYFGDTEIVTQNPELAGRLLRATGR